LEERANYDDVFAKYKLDFINLISPNTSEERVKQIVKDASGFVYYISVNATTGSKAPVVSEIKQQLKLVRKHTKLPIAVGFGINDARQAGMIAKFADFIVVGSKYIKIMEQGRIALNELMEFNREIKSML
jgi:tryptophan synthase alpha chain